MGVALLQGEVARIAFRWVRSIDVHGVKAELLAVELLRPSGVLCLENGDGRSEHVARLLHREVPWNASTARLKVGRRRTAVAVAGRSSSLSPGCPGLEAVLRHNLVDHALKAVQSGVPGSIPGISVVLIIALFLVSALCGAMRQTALTSARTLKETEVPMKNTKKSKIDSKLVVRSSLKTLATVSTTLIAGAALP